MSSSFNRKQRKRFAHAITHAAVRLSGHEAAAWWAYEERLLWFNGAAPALLPAEGWSWESIDQAWRAMKKIKQMSRPPPTLPTYSYTSAQLLTDDYGVIQLDENGNPVMG